MSEFVGIPSSEVWRVWDEVEPLLQKAIDKDEFQLFTTEDIRDKIDDKRNQLWCVFDGSDVIASIVSSIDDFPQARTLNLHWVGGSRLDDWLPEAWGTLCEFGRIKGCHHIRGFGRAGWLRKLKLKPRTQLIWQEDL